MGLMIRGTPKKLEDLEIGGDESLELICFEAQ